jgi:hypothetical protein
MRELDEGSTTNKAGSNRLSMTVKNVDNILQDMGKGGESCVCFRFLTSLDIL